MHRKSLIATAAVATLIALQGCAAGSIASAALQLAGMPKQPELPEAQKPPRNVPLKLHAAANLNAGSGAQALALAVRVYKLRQPATFQQLHFGVFLDADAESAALGQDLLEVREVMLIPGRQIEMVEKTTREAPFIGVVALFRAPAPQRWRLVFPAAEAEKSGITVGLSACAISAGQGAAPVATPADAGRSPSAASCP
ncbi:MAG: type VI secretion system lipoprotein TssJ [Duganella sp.]